MMSFLFSAVLVLHTITSSFSQDVRLVDGKDSSEGRVEVRYNKQWGTVCDDNWSDLTASIVCKQLKKGLGQVLPKGTYPGGTGRIWIDDVTCVGVESSIFECLSRPYGQTDCDHAEDVAIRCNNGFKPTTTTVITPQPSNCKSNLNEIRLIGKERGIGTVEIKHQGKWGTICDDFWDLQDAKVVCRQLCYNETYALPGANKKFIEDNKTPVQVNRLDCKGSEGDLKQCPKFSWGQSGKKCNLVEAASVTCVYQDNNAKKAPIAKLKCTDTEMTAFFNRSADPTLEPKHLEVDFNNTKCNPLWSKNATYVSITVPVSECGMTVQQNTTHIIYRLVMLYLPTKIDGDIVKHNTYRQTLFCAFPRVGIVSQRPWVVQTVAVTQQSVGAFVFAMEFYRKSTFDGKIINFPVQLPLGAWLNVAVLLKTEQNDLKLIVPACWVTASPDRTSNPKHLLFSNKCAVDQSLGLVPLNKTTLGFRFQTFAFFNNSSPLYVHCDTFVCLVDEKTEQCDQTCGFKTGRRKRRSVSSGRINMIYHVSSEPFVVNFQRSIDESDKTTRIPIHTTTLINKKETSDYTTLRQKTHGEQLIVYTTESSRESVTSQVKALVPTDRHEKATESNKNTVGTEHKSQSFTKSTIKTEFTTDVSTTSNNWVLKRTNGSIFVPKTSTRSNIRKPRRELNRGEFAMQTKNGASKISSAASGLKNFQHLQKLYLVLIILWCWT